MGNLSTSEYQVMQMGSVLCSETGRPLILKFIIRSPPLYDNIVNRINGRKQCLHQTIEAVSPGIHFLF